MISSVGITFNLKKDFPARGGEDGHPPDLAAECEEEETVDMLASSLARLAQKVLLFPHNPDMLDKLDQSRPDLVFNIAEGLHGFGREAQVPALLEAYGIPYTFSDALVMALTLHKGLTKHILRDRGLPTPAFVCLLYTSPSPTDS